MSEYQAVKPYSSGIQSGRTAEEMFPPINPEFVPFGSRVLLQVQRVFNTSKGGIVLVNDTKETEAWNMQVARIVSMGPLAFKRRDTAEDWPEGMWASVGDFVRVPRWGGDRWSIDPGDGESPVNVVLLNDSDLLGRHEGDPSRIQAFLA